MKGSLKKISCIALLFILLGGCDSDNTIGDQVDIPLLSDGDITTLFTITTGVPAVGTPAAGRAASFSFSLGGDAFDMEIDTARQRLYVSIPDLNLIRVFELASLAEIRSVIVGDSPHGIDMSPDGTTLYVALNDSGSVAVVDLITFAVTEIVVAVELETGLTYDVVVPSDDLVFVSGNPGSGGSAKIVQIDRANADLVSVVASDNIIRADPFFATSPGDQFLYVGEGFSPNSVYKLDLNQAAVPQVLEDVHGSVSGSIHLDLSADGTQLLMASGQILDTATLAQSSAIGAGVSIFSSDGDNAVVVETPDTINIYSLATGLVVDTHLTACNMSDIQRVGEVQAGFQWILLGDQTVCLVTGVPGPNPITTFIDLLIETAVDGEPVASGDISYELSIVNQGSVDASTVVVEVILPVGAVFNSASGRFWVCNESLGTVTCTRDTVEVGPSDMITVDVTLPATAGVITNTATITSAFIDSDSGNNTSTTNTFVMNPGTSVNLDLGGDVIDMEFDIPRQRLYVSVAGQNSIEVISIDTFTVLSSIAVGVSPQGIDMSLDGDTLFVAINQGGTVAFVDLNTLAVSTVPVATELETTQVFDVISPTNDLVFASGNDGTARIVQIDRANANQVSVIADNQIISGDPTFTTHPGDQFVYLGEDFSPNSIYKLDLFQATVPIDSEDDHGTILFGSTDNMVLNAAGTILYLSSGQILRTDSLTQSGLIARGVSTLSANGTTILVAEDPNTLLSFSLATHLQIGKVYTTCNITEIDRVIEIQADMSWVLLGDQTACRVTIP